MKSFQCGGCGGRFCSSCEGKSPCLIAAHADACSVTEFHSTGRDHTTTYSEPEPEPETVWEQAGELVEA